MRWSWMRIFCENRVGFCKGKWIKVLSVYGKSIKFSLFGILWVGLVGYDEVGLKLGVCF